MPSSSSPIPAPFPADSPLYSHMSSKHSGPGPILRPLGLIVCRGTQVTLINPTDGEEEIENPFLGGEEDEEGGEE